MLAGWTATALPWGSSRGPSACSSAWVSLMRCKGCGASGAGGVGQTGADLLRRRSRTAPPSRHGCSGRSKRCDCLCSICFIVQHPCIGGPHDAQTVPATYPATWATNQGLLALGLCAVLPLQRGCIGRSTSCDHVHVIVKSFVWGGKEPLDYSGGACNISWLPGRPSRPTCFGTAKLPYGCHCRSCCARAQGVISCVWWGHSQSAGAIFWSDSDGRGIWATPW